MADLDNLLDEINDGDGNTYDRHDQRPIFPYNGEEGSNDGNSHSFDQDSIPTALTTAAATRLLLEDENDYFAMGYEEQDDDENGDILIVKADKNDGNDYNRKINPEYEQLKGLWTSELACPELLPHDADTVLNVEELTKQEAVIESLLQRSKQQRQSLSREVGASGEIASLVAQITKMDLDRTRFMLVDLARTRMAKIENHALHNRTLLDRMTEEETSYLRQYGELLEKHYQRSVLNILPKEAWKKLDESEMIDSPDLEQFVFCHVLETVQIDVMGEPTTLKNVSLVNEEEDESDYGENVQEHRVGSYLIVMYKSVRELVFEGKVELVM